MEQKYGQWEHILETYKNATNEGDDHLKNKLSQIIWQRYASSVWDDIRNDNVLPFKDSREEDDEKHVHPLQLDVIDHEAVARAQAAGLLTVMDRCPAIEYRARA